MDDLHRRLREAADAHQPDRDAMLVRIERGIAGAADADRALRHRRRRQASWLKVSLAGAAGVGVLSLGGLALAAGVDRRAPEHPVSPAVSSTSSTVAATPSPTPPQPPTSKPTRAPGVPVTRPGPSSSAAGPSGSLSGSPSSAPAVTDGPLTARGVVNSYSTVYWEQNDLTVDVAQPLDALTVELRVAQTAGVQSTGWWQTAASDDYTVTVTPVDGFLVYRWTLKPGRTVPGASRQVFAAQFNHGTGPRDASKDVFQAESVAGGRTSVVRGGFGSGG